MHRKKAVQLLNRKIRSKDSRINLSLKTLTWKYSDSIFQSRVKW